MRVLVTGCNGFVGRALCPYLRARGHEVRAAVREPSASGACGADAESVVGDISGATSWTEALRDVDAVIHLAARAHVLHEEASDPLQAYRRTNTAGAAHLARSAAGSGVRRLVFVSSIGVHGSTGHGSEPIRESSAIRPDKDYAVSKWEAEEELREIAGSTTMETVTVRPTLVHGPHVGGNFLRLLGWASRGLPLPLGSVDNRRSYLGVDNLSDFLAHCLEAPRAAGEAFVLSDGDALSTAELIRRLGHHLGRRARLLPFPAAGLRALGALTGRGEDVARLLGSLVVDSAKARELLDWTPPKTMDQGLAAMCAWYAAEFRGGGPSPS